MIHLKSVELRIHSEPGKLIIESKSKRTDFTFPITLVKNENAAAKDLVLLSLIPGIGTRILTRLLEHFKNATQVFHASEKSLSDVPGVGGKLIESIQRAKEKVPIERIVDWCVQNNCQILLRNSDAYPRALAEIHNPPVLLFSKGCLDSLSQPCVAIVGTRNPTPYGRRQAKILSGQLADSGVSIVSGLARGIDGIAHQACIDRQGKTIAILGSGLGSIYPSEHYRLAQQIEERGLLLSEHVPFRKPNRQCFPQRNRIISGLCPILVVIEAPERSGSLITARLALEQNREVMAVPGPISSSSSRGCHALIRDGAKLVQNVGDILEELPNHGINLPDGDGCLHRIAGKALLNHAHTTREAASPRSREHLTNRQQGILDAIAEDGCYVDTIIQQTGLPAQSVLATISILELKGYLKRSSNQKIYLN